MSGPLHRHLAGSELFRDLPAELLAGLEPLLTTVTLEGGADLVRQGDPGDAMFVLVEGRLDVLVTAEPGHEVVVDNLGPGTSVGEMALMAGQERTATVRAAGPANLVRLARHDFEVLLAANPELGEAVFRLMQPRLQRIQLGSVLEQWFPELDAGQIRDLQDSVSWHGVAAGSQLYAQGDAADGMYLLVSGRLRLSERLPDGSERLIGEIARGASVGELAVLDGGSRGETVTAIRDSQLVRLDAGHVTAHPQVLRQIARNALARAATVGRSTQERPGPPRTLLLVPAGPAAPALSLARSLAAGLGDAMVLDRQLVAERFSSADAADAGPGDGADQALTHWLNEMEGRHDCLLLVADPHSSGWTRRCIGIADKVLLVAVADGAPEPAEAERELPAGYELVLVQSDDCELPQGTSRWLEPRRPLTHYHVRLGNEGDVARLARRLTGRAIGLALSGGGARAYVHIGLVKLLEELGVPVDMVAGTSMGALVGGVYAHRLNFDHCYRIASRFGDPKMLLDKTLPLVALAESKNVTATFQSMFDDVRIEDLWVPYMCVSANLTRAEPVLHERGPLWEAIRASTAIPGIFTPVVQGGDVLVDGGIMNNYPVDVIRERNATGLVIGSNAESASRNQSYDFGHSVSGWQVLLDRFRPAGRRRKYPSILGTLMRSTSVSSKHLGAGADALADVTVRYPAQDFGNLEFDRYPELTDIGYAAAVEKIGPWWEAVRGEVKLGQ